MVRIVKQKYHLNANCHETIEIERERERVKKVNQTEAKSCPSVKKMKKP